MNVAGGDLSWVSTLNDSQFQASIRRMEQSVNRTTDSILGQGSKLEEYAKKAANVAAGFFSVQAATEFIQSMVRVRSEFQQLEIAFSTMLKSKVAANALMKDIILFAGTTPFGLKETAGAAKQLLAYGSTAKNVVGELRMLGDVAAGVSVPIGDLVYLYGTLKTQGRAYAMDIRQFAGRGIPIYAELAKVMGRNKDEIAGLVEAGKVGFPEVEKAFKNMTSAAGMFGGLMEAQSHTLTGQIERLKDAWDVMLNELGKSQEGLFAGGIEAASKLVENYQDVLNIIGIVAGAFGVYKAAMFATAAYQKAYEVSTFGLVVAVNQESVAEIANANAKAVDLRATVSSLAVKKSAALQSATNAIAALEEAKANLANASSSALVNAQNKSTIAGKAALAAASEFAAAKTNLETLSKAGATEAELVRMRTEVTALAAKKASTLQTYQATIANVKNIESKVAQQATERVSAAQEQVAITRKAAIAAQSEFSAAKTNLETTAKVANSAATVELTAVEALNASGKRALAAAQAAYNAVLAASPMLAFTAIVTALGIAIYSLTQITNAAEEAQKAINKANEDGGKSADSEKRKVEQLVEVIKSQTASLEQKKEAYDQLNQSTDNMLKGYSMEDIAANKAIKTLDQYIQKIREAAAAKSAWNEFNELGDKKDALKRNGIDGVDRWTRMGRSLQNTFLPSSKGISFKDWAKELVDGRAGNERIVDQEIEVITAQMDKLKAVFSGNGEWNKLITGKDDSVPKSNAKNKAFFEAIVKDNTEKLEALDKASKDFEKNAAPLKKKISDAQRELLSFDVRKPGAIDRSEESALKRKAEMLNKIFELNEKYNNKSLVDDEEKLAGIRSDYKALQRDIDQYNNNPKNKKVNPDLKPQLERAIENQQYRTDTEKLQVELEKQKNLYADYEAYKIAAGADAAEKRYSKEFDISLTYLQRLEAERGKLLTKDPTAMSGPELERLKFYDTQINEQVAAEKRKYDDLVKELINYEQQRRLLTEKYNKEFAQIQGNDSLTKRAELTKRYKFQLGDLDDSNVKNLTAYKDLYRGIDQLSDESAKKVVYNAKNMLDTLLLNGKVSQEMYDEINRLIHDTSRSLEERLPDNIINIATKIDGITNAVTEVNREFGMFLSTTGAVLGQVGNIKKELVNLENLKKGDVLGQVSSGLGILGAGISIFQTVFKLFDRSAQREEQAAYSRDLQNKQTEALNKSLERQVQLIDQAYGTDRLLKYNEAIKAATDNEAKYQEQLKGRYALTGNKTVDEWIEKVNNGGKLMWNVQEMFDKIIAGGGITKLPESLKDLQDLLDNGKLDAGTRVIVENLIKATQTADDLRNKLNADNIGQSLDSIADAFISTLTDGTQDFGKSFEDVIKKSLLNGFKSKFIQDQLQGFYDKFAELSKNGLDDSEVEMLRKLYLSMGEEGKKRLEELKKITGIDLTTDDDSKNTLKGQLQAELTEQTGTQFLGVSRASYEQHKLTVEGIREQCAISNQIYGLAVNHFNATLKIEENTRRGADNTEGIREKLDKIVVNTTPKTVATQTKSDLGM